MARKIQDPEEAAEAATPPPPEGSAIFVKNQTNELIKFPDGTTYKFDKPKVVITDGALIAKLREVAKGPNPYKIFENVPPAPVAPMAPLDQPSTNQAPAPFPPSPI